MNKSEAIKYVDSQTSLHLYKHIQDAFVEVLCKLTYEEFEKVTNNLIVMAFHEGIKGQVMHFPARKKKFAVMQLYIPKHMPDDILRHVIAHELGHVMQGRNYIESDGDKLEVNANEYAKKLGYPTSKEIDDWLEKDK